MMDLITSYGWIDDTRLYHITSHCMVWIALHLLAFSVCGQVIVGTANGQEDNSIH
jgi:hypothetical protein